jgi:Protein of unknown function (DUF2442)
MSTLPNRPEPRAVRVTFDADSFTVHLNDGRALSVPYVYSSRLAEATPEQRADYRLIGRGDGIHWPQIDEDLSVAGLLRAA